MTCLVPDCLLPLHKRSYRVDQEHPFSCKTKTGAAVAFGAVALVVAAYIAPQAFAAYALYAKGAALVAGVFTLLSAKSDNQARQPITPPSDNQSVVPQAAPAPEKNGPFLGSILLSSGEIIPLVESKTLKVGETSVTYKRQLNITGMRSLEFTINSGPLTNEVVTALIKESYDNEGCDGNIHTQSKGNLIELEYGKFLMTYSECEKFCDYHGAPGWGKKASYAWMTPPGIALARNNQRLDSWYTSMSKEI